MKSTKQLSSVGALCIALSLFGVSLNNASAQQAPCTECQELPRSMGARVCVPNTQNWGYFTGTWRVWPEERRPDVTFPRAVGAERVPTPAPGQVPASGSISRLPSRSPSGVPAQSSETVLPTIDFGSSAPSGNSANSSNPLIGGQEAFEPKELLPSLEPAPTAVPAPVPLQESAPVVKPAEKAVELPTEQPAEKPAPKAPGASDLDASLPMVDSESVSSSSTAPAGDINPVLPSDPMAPVNTTTPANGALPPLTLPAAPPSDTSPSEFGLPPLTGGPQAAPKGSAQTAANTPNVPVTDNKTDKSLDSMKYAFRSRNSGKQETAQEQPAAKTATPAAANQNLTRNQQKIDTNVAPTTYIAPAVEKTNPVTNSSAAAKITEPLALDGFCPVELINNESWKSGQEDWAVIFEGRAYFCSSPKDRELFMEDPMRYTPVCKGQDPLYLLQQNRQVDGRTDFCVIYGKKLYLFSSAVTMKQFRDNPKQFARQIAELEAKNM